ncbi:MAG: hypothetical protein WAZ77_04625 [Candidatus Nitrosopolaris sp.]
MARRPPDPKMTIIGIPTNSSGNIEGVSRGSSAPTKKICKTDRSISGRCYEVSMNE